MRPLTRRVEGRFFFRNKNKMTGKVYPNHFTYLSLLSSTFPERGRNQVRGLRLFPDEELLKSHLSLVGSSNVFYTQTPVGAGSLDGVKRPHPGLLNINCI